MTHDSRATERSQEEPELAAVEQVMQLLRNEPQFAHDVVLRPHPLVITIARGELSVVLTLGSVWDRGRDLLRPFATRLGEGRATLLLLGRPSDPSLGRHRVSGLFGVLPRVPAASELFVPVGAAFEYLDARSRAEHRGRWLNQYQYEVGQLVDIARAMTTERDLSKLLSLILEKCRFVTGADAGSIYVVEGEDPSPVLRFKLTQNESVSFDATEFVMPISNRSIAGSAALTKKSINLPDVYDLAPGSPFGFDRTVDERIGYRTKSMLTVPLVSQLDEVIGIIQLINKKKTPGRCLTTAEDVEEDVVAFDARSEELLGMVAAQAAVSLENALLYSEIRQLFEGFVTASVEAIESRDPTTSGHSRRVADLTVALAKAVDRTDAGPYARAFFTTDDMRELEYASLLHDFGKIGVREKVLVKARKLYDEELALIRARFDFAEKAAEVDVLRRKMRAVERGAPKSELEAFDREEEERRKSLESAWQAIVAANEPTVLAAGDFARLEDIAKETYFDMKGQLRPLLEPHEAGALAVRKGSLTPSEYDEISGHVSHTFRFLSQIPWGKHLRRVPTIAVAHHERLNGTGYPNKLVAEEIPVQSKMMSIADIFDALTASDRPYKKAVPVERALDILHYGVNDGHLDPELVRIFKEVRAWEPARRG